MNPIASLLVVIFGIILFIRILFWMNQKLQKNNNPFLNKIIPLKKQKVSVESVIPIDEKYKVAVLLIEEQETTLLLGPSNALVLGEKNKKSKETLIQQTENLAS